MKKQITCYIADDSIFFRKVMQDICKELEIEVLGEYESGDKMVDIMMSNSIYPDMVFLDINMPGRSGKEILDVILDMNPEFIVIMISTVEDIKVIRECLELGASNYIHKNSGKPAMKEIILSTIKNSGLL